MFGEYTMNLHEIIKELCKIYFEQGFKTVGPDLMEDYNWERQNLGGYPVVEQNSVDFNNRNQNKRARQIGETLNEKGGFSFMQQVAYSVQNEIGSKPVNELSRCWNGIGDWID